MPTPIATINQIVQLGVESTAGVPPGGGSNRLMRHLTYNIDPDFQYTMYRGSGQRFNSVMTQKMDWSKWTLGGPISYTEMAYPFAGLWGTPVITTPANGVLARQLAFSPKLSGAQGGITVQLQNGDAVRTRQINYGCQTGIDLTLKRSGDSVVSGGAGFGAQMQPSVTLTGSPTSQPQLPAPPVNFNVFLDTSSAQIGVTPIAQCVEAQFKTSGWYAPVWFLVRSNPSFGAVVDTPPVTTLLLRIIPDSIVDNYWIQARAGATCYIRIDAVGNPIDNVYSLNGSASYSAGTFTLTYKGATTTAIAFNALGSAILAAVNALPTVPASSPCTITNSGLAFNTANTFVISFAGVLANDPSLLTANFSLTGGAPALTSLVVANNLRIDCAAKYVPQQMGDEAGAWVQDWLFEIVGDPAWTEAGAGGTALYAQLINTMTAL
jgi:hypothetical protein